MDEVKLTQELKELQGLLESSAHPSTFQTVVGFDGFVDEIIDVVDKRQSFDSYKRIETIAQLGERISKAAGLSTNIELVTKTEKLGGNGPIMANALVSFGAKVNYIGAIGNPDIHQVFKEMANNCQSVYSIAEPGHTDALEFNDGKVMLGKIQSLNEVNWENLFSKVGEESLTKLFSKSDLIATVNWTMTPYMNEIWHNLLKILPQKTGEKPIFFIDLADPEKRNDEDIYEALEIVQDFSPYFRVALGLNRKEASEIARVFGLSDNPAELSLAEITEAISDRLQLWCLMVHPTHEAAAISEGQYAYTSGPFTSNPKLTTGAGDNFNSGFCLGLLLGLPLQKALMLGKATSGYYVRNMHSPSFAQLKDFVGLWSKNVGKDF